MQKSEEAFQQLKFVEPAEGSALSFARRARELDPQSPDPPAMEERILEMMLRETAVARRNLRYDEALNQVARLESLFPNRPEVADARREIESDKEANLRAKERQAYEARFKRYNVQHRHVVNVNLAEWRKIKFYCWGTLTIAPEGWVRYDCTGTGDPSGRCDHVLFPPGSIRGAKMEREDRLRITEKVNYDFYGTAASMREAYEAILPLVSKKKE
jgi:hypothetical protein